MQFWWIESSCLNAAPGGGVSRDRMGGTGNGTRYGIGSNLRTAFVASMVTKMKGCLRVLKAELKLDRNIP